MGGWHDGVSRFADGRKRGGRLLAFAEPSNPCCGLACRSTDNFMQSIDLEKSHNLSTPTRAEYRSRFPIRLEALRWFGRQTWIPRGRDRILRMALSPETCQPYSFEVDFFGLRYRGDLSQYIDWLVFMYGSYAYWELNLLEAISEELRKAQSTVNFFDVGANVGHHTLFMGRAQRMEFWRLSRLGAPGTSLLKRYRLTA